MSNQNKPEELRARAKRSGREECGVNPASSEQAVSPPSQVAPEAKEPDWWEAVKRGLLEFANNWEPDDPAPLARALADLMDELRAKARPNLTVELLVRHVTALESRVTTLEDNYETAHQFAHDFDSRLRVLEASDSLLREIEEGKQRIAESQEQTKAQASPSERLAPIAGNPGCGSERTEVAWVSDAKGTHIVITGPLNHKIECADDCLLAFADGTLLAADETHWTFDVKRKGSSRLSASIDNPYECPSWRIVLDGRIEWLVVTEADNVAERPMDALVFLEDSQPSAGGFPPTGDSAAERTSEPDTASQIMHRIGMAGDPNFAARVAEARKEIEVEQAEFDASSPSTRVESSAPQGVEETAADPREIMDGRIVQERVGGYCFTREREVVYVYRDGVQVAVFDEEGNESQNLKDARAFVAADQANVDPFSDSSYIYIRTEEDRKRFAPKRATDEFWSEFALRWLTVGVHYESYFRDHFTYRRRKKPIAFEGEGWPCEVHTNADGYLTLTGEALCPFSEGTRVLVVREGK